MLLLSLLLPPLLLVMLRLLERYERLLDEPVAAASTASAVGAPDVVHLVGTDKPAAGGVPHPRIMPLATPLGDAVGERG